MAEELLKVKNISKAYSGVQALDKVSMTVKKGEIHCLVGENGSGKSTLIKIVSGVVKQDEGEIIINGIIHRHLSVIDSIREGIQVIYQDLSIFPNLSVAENIVINQLVERQKKFFNWREIKKNAKAALCSISYDIDLDEMVENISIANRQLIAICRAITHGAKIIIMDECTTALTKNEIDSLFSVILGLKERGISILFISHKLSEVFQISENITVLRDGQKVGDYRKDKIDNDKLIFLMTGKRIDDSKFEYKRKKDEKNILMEVKNLSGKGFKDVSFKLYQGEILGIAGLLGSGRTEFAQALFGLNRTSSGEIYIKDRLVKINSTKDAINNGISFVPEDRQDQGLFLEESIVDNIIISILKKILNKFKLISARKREKVVKKWVKELEIKIPSVELPAKSLSGGNQQRLVLARWLATNAKILILDGPTVGIDVASKSDIHKNIRNLASKGGGIIIISDEFSEIITHCNRILIMSKGRIIKDLNNTENVTEDMVFNIINEDSDQKSEIIL